MNTKRCSKCGLDKSTEDFGSCARSGDGLQPWCRACYKDYSKARQQDPEAHARDLAYSKMKYERYKASGMGGFRQKVSRLKCTFGLTMEQYIQMAMAQNNVCAICGQPASRDGKDCCLDVDHDHATGKIRGLLCKNCNIGLGNLGDSSERLRKAADYLDRQK